MLLDAYCQGAFPMARGRDSHEVYWFSPDPRGVIPLDTFHRPRSLQRVIRRGTFDVSHDNDFEQVIRGCAAPRRYEQETWINDGVIDAYCQLHALGYAHSIEVRRDGMLVGGLYGVAIGAAFFGESMFHLPGIGNNASKVALAATVDHLNLRGYTLFDVQFTNPFLEPFGVDEIPRDHYLQLLDAAVRRRVTWYDPPR